MLGDTETSINNMSFDFVMKVVFVILLVALFMSQSGCCQHLKIYISMEGDDSFSGTKEAPLKTLEAARQMIRSEQDVCDTIIVWLREGVYEQKDSFRLGVEDSGMDAKPIIYRSYLDETVVISGGVRVTGWKKIKEKSILQRVNPIAREHIWQAELKSHDVFNYGTPDAQHLELFFQNKPMKIARWPNNGFGTIADLVDPGTINVRGILGSRTGDFYYAGTRPERWADEKDGWLHGYWFWDWAEKRQQISQINTNKKIISLKKPYHHYGYRKGQWYYAFNMLSELDQPGEYYLDRETGILYFWPPDPMGESDAVVSVSNILVTLQGASHIILKNLTFEYTQGTAVVMKNGDGNKIVGCTFRNIGDTAVKIQGGRNSGVEDSHLYQLGAGGVLLAGGVRSTLIPGLHFAENNHIHNYGRVKRMYSPAVNIKGVGNRARNNEIHDAPHQAVAFSGNDHDIAFNEIYDVCKESNDAGAIYAGRDWSMRGNVIRSNPHPSGPGQRRMKQMKKMVIITL